jgi:hypothetical protein
MNYVIPYAKHRTNTGSGAGVPLILKSKGLANGEGLYGDCFNLPIKQGGVWLKEAEMESMLTSTLVEFGKIPELIRSKRSHKVINERIATSFREWERV